MSSQKFPAFNHEIKMNGFFLSITNQISTSAAQMPCSVHMVPNQRTNYSRDARAVSVTVSAEKRIKLVEAPSIGPSITEFNADLKIFYCVSSGISNWQIKLRQNLHSSSVLYVLILLWGKFLTKSYNSIWRKSSVFCSAPCI